MVYDVEYEIAAQIFVLFIFVYSCINYPMRNRKNMLFRIMSIILILTQSFDIISAYVISYNDIFSRISIRIWPGHSKSNNILQYTDSKERYGII